MPKSKKIPLKRAEISVILRAIDALKFEAQSHKKRVEGLNRLIPGTDWAKQEEEYFVSLIRESIEAANALAEAAKFSFRTDLAKYLPEVGK